MEEGSAKNLSTISADSLPKCSVFLEKINVLEFNNSNENRTSDQKHESAAESTSLVSQPMVNHSENMVIDMDVMDTMENLASINPTDTIPAQNDIEYPRVLHIEPDHQLDHEQNKFYFGLEYFDETLSPTQNFETNPFDTYNFSQNHLATTIDIMPEFQLKEEKIDALPIYKMGEVIEVLDSDEEEAVNSRDSGRDTNDTTIDLDSSHIPTMGVLMMSKK